MPLISAYDFTFDETFSSFSIAERTALSLSSFEDFFRSSFIAIVVYRISFTSCCPTTPCATSLMCYFVNIIDINLHFINPLVPVRIHRTNHCICHFLYDYI